MFFEIPFVIALSFVAIFIVFKINKIQFIEGGEVPLPELAEDLLLELKEINNLDVNLRKEAKKKWNDRFNIYHQRKSLESKVLKADKLQLVKK